MKLTTARKEHQCEFCHQVILPKERYYRVTCTPWDHPDNDGFSNYKVCRFCWESDQCFPADTCMYNSEFHYSMEQRYSDKISEVFGTWADLSRDDREELAKKLGLHPFPPIKTKELN